MLYDGDSSDDGGIEIGGAGDSTGPAPTAEVVSVLRLKRGDLLVLRVPGSLDAAMHRSLHEAIQGVVPPGVRAIVLEQGCTFQRVTVEGGD